jgi:hypothetical protein
LIGHAGTPFVVQIGGDGTDGSLRRTIFVASFVGSFVVFPLRIPRLCSPGRDVNQELRKPPVIGIKYKYE